jgi:hypothetical protein
MGHWPSDFEIAVVELNRAVRDSPLTDRCVARRLILEDLENIEPNPLAMVESYYKTSPFRETKDGARALVFKVCSAGCISA